MHVTFNPAGSFAVDHLKPDTLYRFSLAARSDMGLGVYTQPIEARTAQSSKPFFFFSSLTLSLSRVFPPSHPLTSDFAEWRSAAASSCRFNFRQDNIGVH